MVAYGTLDEAIGGDAASAEARARAALATDGDPRRRITWHGVRVHALVALGRGDEAEAILRQEGPAVIALVARNEGPASPIARGLQSGTAYR